MHFDRYDSQFLFTFINIFYLPWYRKEYLNCTVTIFSAQLDVVSTLLSNFFVCAYALINFSVFHASVTKSPGWRPSFKASFGKKSWLAVIIVIHSVKESYWTHTFNNLYYQFQYYHPFVALIGTVLCVVVMFLMDWVTALVTFGIVAILYLYISYRKPGSLQNFRKLSNFLYTSR